jgi:alkylation response protein AidB-like acyl-CoA dehydrogenase
MDALAALVAPAGQEFADLEAFLAALAARVEGVASPADRAILGGVLADRLGYAFVAGYHAALGALVPGGARRCLCATEEGGAHPRAIATMLRADGDGFRLDGKKRFSTLATVADELLVVASTGVDAAGKNRLKLVCVPAGADGLTITPMPATPFAPEVPHAEVTLAGVRVEAAALLPGDGYDDYLKPFRTVEDVHVHLAALAWFARVAHAAGFPAALRERLLALIAAARDLATRDPSAPATHLALAGVIDLSASWLEDCAPTWAAVDEDTRTRFERDRPLLRVAGKAREARRAAAWARAGSI